MPPNVTVCDPLPAVNVPLLTRSPFIWRFPDGVRVPVIVIAPNVGVTLPLSVVVPEKVTVLVVIVGAEFTVRAPFRSIGMELEIKPPFNSNVPFTVTAVLSVTEPLLTVKSLRTVVDEGSSFPEVMPAPA